jgi:hypothetical protein
MRCQFSLSNRAYESFEQEQLDKLNEDITLAELEEDARLDKLDIEGAVNFAQFEYFTVGAVSNRDPTLTSNLLQPRSEVLLPTLRQSSDSQSTPYRIHVVITIPFRDIQASDFRNWDAVRVSSNTFDFITGATSPSRVTAS